MINDITLNEFESKARNWLDANAQKKQAVSEKEAEW